MTGFGAAESGQAGREPPLERYPVGVNCPACDQEIPFRRVLLAVNPIFIRCPHCQAPLRGDKTMMLMGAAVVLLAIAIAIPGIVWIGQTIHGPLRWLAFAAFIVALSALIGIPMTRVTMRRGRYVLREPNA